MKQNMVVTNLRMDENNYRTVKVMAAEMGMSLNQYITYLIQHVSTRRELIPNVQDKKSDYPIWKIYKLAFKKKKSKGMGLSEEDKIIYGDY